MRYVTRCKRSLPDCRAPQVVIKEVEMRDAACTRNRDDKNE